MIKFYRGPVANYTYGKSEESTAKFKDNLYFATDVGKLYLNGLLYCDSDIKKVIDVTAKTDDASKIVITYSDNSTAEVSVGKTTYTPAVDGELAMPNDVGGIKSGTKASDLSGKTYDAMFDDLLFPTVYPVAVAPTLSILNPTTTIAEVGATTGLTSESDVTYKYTQGYYTLSGKATSVARAGAETSHTVAFTGYTEVPTNYSIDPGSLTITVTVNYAEGGQPKDNKGNNYGSPLAAGSIKATKTINVTMPYYASTVTTGVETKQALISWNTTAGKMTTTDLTLKAVESGSQLFVLPRAATSLQMFNTVSNKYETVALSDWTKTEVSRSINGNVYTYYKYVYAGATRGSVKIKVTF